jgi:hypothetical protein
MIDLHAPDPVFGGARRTAQVEDLIDWARAALEIGPDRPWTVVSTRQKLGKTLFEIDENGQRIVGKVSRSGRAQHTYATLSMLWNAGMKPPSKYVVTEPVAWFPERQLLLQAKAQGTQWIDLVRDRNPLAMEAAAQAGQWLHKLQGLRVEAEAAPLPDVERCRAGLVNTMPELAARIDAVASSLHEALSSGMPTVPSHGDYHPLNLFLAPDGTVTAIDLDTFGLREQAADTAYCLAQTAIMGYHTLGSFGATAGMRSEFLRAAPPARGDRVDVLIRWALLRALHYDFCILKLAERGHVEPFLGAAEYGL